MGVSVNSLQCAKRGHGSAGAKDTGNRPPRLQGLGCIQLLDFSLSSFGWRRGLGRGGAFLLVSPLLGPLPTRSSRGEDGELDAALMGSNLRFVWAASSSSLSSIGWRRGLGRGGAFLLVSPLLGPPPLVPRGERMESLMQP